MERCCACFDLSGSVRQASGKWIEIRNMDAQDIQDRDENPTGGLDQFLKTRSSLDLTGFRVALPIPSAWGEIIPTGAENPKTCQGFSRIYGQTVQVVR